MLILTEKDQNKMINTSDLPEQTFTSVPRVIHDEMATPDISVDPERLAETMRELGVSEQGISDTTVYMDPKSRLQTFGTHYPNMIGRLRFRSIPEIQEAEGDIVRLSTVMKGKPRTAEEVNRTLVHELEHRAQEERHDPKLTQGHIAIYGLALAGAIIGNRLGGSKTSRAIGTAMGAAIGHSVGYIIAPHERQARARAREVTSNAVMTK